MGGCGGSASASVFLGYTDGTNDSATGRGTAVAAGMYLSDDIYVEIITDAKGYTATQIEISLSRTLSLLSQFGTNSGTNVNIRYNRDY